MKKDKNNNKRTINNTAQKSIPYLHAYSNGIIEIKPKVYSKSYFLEDINFKIVSQDLQEDIFMKYGGLLNGFGAENKAQITIFNRTIPEEDYSKRILLEHKHDGLDEYRDEQNEILNDKIAEGKNNKTKELYLTITSEAEDFEAANLAFNRIDTDIQNTVKKISMSSATPLTLEDRLNILFDIYNPDMIGFLNRQIELGDGKEPIKSFDMASLEKQGLTTKDFIAPPVIEFNPTNFKVGEKYGQILYLQNLPSFLSTDFIEELADLPFSMLISLHYDAMANDKATKLLRNQIVNIDSNVIDKQKRATRSGYSIDLISPELKKAQSEADKILNDITSRNQKLFHLTFVVAHFADTPEEIEHQYSTITSVSQKHIVTLRKLQTQQESGLAAAIPLGINNLSLKRLLTTEAASVFIPFSVQELSQKTGFYYGLNAISRNLILFDRTKSKNANGIILGTPGSGKSFAAKREILNVLLQTDDDVYIIDPEGEYSPLATMFGGEIIKIAAGGKTNINPMDMDIDYADEEDPVTLKSDFICSLCETVLGGRYGLSVTQHSIIDRCVRNVYQPYLDYLQAHSEIGTSDYSKTPTLKNLYNELLKQPEAEARTIALALERFVVGSLDTFANKTNVNIKSRFVVYNIKDIGTGLKEFGLQVCLNDIWNRTIQNKKKHKRTWFYIDEFYLLTQTESSATFLQQIFKRARKWGGVPTGITQNVEDLLVNKEARTILSNCDFVLMLNQSPQDRYDLAKMFNISTAQLSYITNVESGQGLLYTGKTIVPFIDKYPTNTKSFAAMTSSVDDVELQKSVVGIVGGID